jgi:hypothetical protein
LYSKKGAEHCANPKENETCVRFIRHMSTVLKANKENTDAIKKLVEIYYTPHIMENYIKSNSSDVSIPLKMIFNFNKIPSNHEEGFNFFKRLNEKVTCIKNFNNSFAYELYFAYQLKRFTSVERFVDLHSCDMASNKYSEATDFLLYNYFRGLILLGRRVSF